MSKSGSRYGRRSNWFKIHCLLQQQQQQQKHRLRCGGGGRKKEDCGGGDGVSKLSPPPLPPTIMLPLPVPMVPMPLFFGFAPKCWTPLPPSEHSAFRKTVCRSNDDDDDRPIDLTVRGQFVDDDDNNNKNTKQYVRKFRSPALHDRKDTAAITAPLDLTRTNRNFSGIRSWELRHAPLFKRFLYIDITAKWMSAPRWSVGTLCYGMWTIFSFFEKTSVRDCLFLLTIRVHISVFSSVSIFIN